MKIIMITTIYDISVTCNYRCIYCRNDWTKPGNSKQPPFEEIKKVIDAICQKNFKKIILTGGEFFTIPYWKEVLSYIKNIDLKIWLVTNAALIEPKDIPFLENYVERINISFHTADRKLYNRIMGISDSHTFDKVVRNLRLLGKSKIETGIFFTPLRLNFLDLFDTVKFLVDSRVKLSHLNLNRLIPTQHTLIYLENEKPLSYFEHRMLVEQSIRINQELSIDVFLEAYPVCFLNKFIEDEQLIKTIDQPCFLGRKAIALAHDGSLKLCPASGYSVDKVRLDTFQTGNWRNPVCCDCRYWDICLGGCHASKGEAYSDDSLIIDDWVDFKDGIDPTFFDLLINLYKPFLNTAFKKAYIQHTILSRYRYTHPIGIIAVNHTKAKADFVEIALIPDLKEKYYSFLTMQKLFQAHPSIKKYGWTVHKSNFPSVTLLERLNGGFYENTIKNTNRIEAEGFFKVRQPAPPKMQAALKQLKPQSEAKFHEWLNEFSSKKIEKQELQKYLEEYKP